MAIARIPTSFHLFIGDTLQGGPVGIQRTNELRAILQSSLLHRMMKSSGPSFRLFDHYRGIKDVLRLTNTPFYDGTLQIQVDALLRQFYRRGLKFWKNFKLDTTAVFIDLSGTKDIRCVNTSRCNSSEAEFCLKFAILIAQGINLSFAEIMIVSGYYEQIQMFKRIRDEWIQSQQKNIKSELRILELRLFKSYEPEDHHDEWSGRSRGHMRYN